jgi:hypothetical protein
VPDVGAIPIQQVLSIVLRHYFLRPHFDLEAFDLLT